MNLPPLGVSTTLFPWIYWGLWTARNKRIFEGKHTTPEEIIGKAIWFAREWIQAQILQAKTHIRVRQGMDDSRSSGTATLGFTDAAWNATYRSAGCGWILFTPKGSEILHGSCSFHNISSPIMAEAMVVRAALSQAHQIGISEICIKLDCQVLVASLSSHCHPADIYGITRDIETLSSCFSASSFVYISRTLNSQADSLAKAALYSNYLRPTN